jgi:hypothetical protein
MMKYDKPNYTEIENLSAYLDHELSELEEGQLRDRLAQDAGLREQLEALRLTRYTLRHAPKVQRQRSFTLSAEVVRKQKFAWTAMNFSRMVAAAASVLFVLVIGGEVLFSGSTGMLASAPAENSALAQDSVAAEAPMAMEAAPEEEMQEAPMEAMMAEPVEEPAAEETMPPGMGGEIQTTPTVQANEPAALAPAPQVTPEPGGGGGVPPTAQATEWGVGGGAPPTATPEAAMDERVIPSEKVMEETKVVEAEMPTAAAAEGEAFETGLADGMGGAEQQEPAPIPLIRWFQGGLLVLALLSGAVALYFRKQVR